MRCWRQYRPFETKTGASSTSCIDTATRFHRFTMIERWRDEHALHVHGEAPAFQTLARALDGKATLQVVLLEKLI